MEVNSLTLVEVMCYAQDDSFGMRINSDLTPFYNFQNLNIYINKVKRC